MSTFGSKLWGSSLWGASLFTPGMGTQAGQILITARTHLDDDDGNNWTDNRLLPKLQEAHRELQLKLVVNHVPVINAVSINMSVPKNTTDLSATSGYPKNMIEPLWLKERSVGQNDQDFVSMVQVDFIPNILSSTELTWWCWQGQTILLLGSSQDREVQLRYRKGLSIPLEATDPIGVLMADSFLSYKTAALALLSLGRDDPRIQMLSQLAESGLQSLLQAAAMESQNLPAKRRPYHRGRGRNRVLRDF